jgi:hypothetical protein
LRNARMVEQRRMPPEGTAVFAQESRRYLKAA